MKLFITLSIAALVAVSQCAEVQDDITSWQQFKETFGKKYASIEEEAVRKANFEITLKYIRENQGKHGVVLGINEFSDISSEEFASMVSASPFPEEPYEPTETVDLYESLPQRWDWREHLTFQPIENQGRCSACWAFAAATAVEAAFAHQKNIKVHLSRQELVDCTNRTYDHDYLNYGCKGGWPTEAFKYMMAHGVYEDKIYPYHGTFNEVCYTPKLAKDHQKKYFIYNYGRLGWNDTDEAIMGVLKTYGPGTVDIHATSDTFRNYKGGIMRNVMPHSAYTNHIVVVVGWGTENGVDYWIIRNSWGERWGEHGYGRLERHHNLVGFNNKYNYPILN